MINKYSYTFYLRKDLCKTSAAKPIHFRAFINRQKVTFSTSEMVEPKNWDEKNRRVMYVKNGNLAFAKVNAINLVLDSIAHRAQAVYH